MTELELAYAAGVIDSDGCIGVKRSDYAMRVRGDASQPVYAERVTLKQVEPQAVDLLHSLFGGYRGMTDPTAKRGRPLHTWHIHSKSAAAVLVAVLPHLRIKRVQAENAIRLRAVMSTRRQWPVPEIRDGEPMVTATQFAAVVGVNPMTILQAARLGSIPSRQEGRSRLIPVSYAEAYRVRMLNGGKVKRSAEVSEQLEALYQRAKELNRVGVR